MQTNEQAERALQYARLKRMVRRLKHCGSRPMAGYRSPGTPRPVLKRVSPWALCRVCGSEVQDWRFRDHLVCLARRRAA